MRYAYGWAFADGARKLRYNLAITAISVIVAVAVGTTELVAMFGHELGLDGGVWQLAASLDLNVIGLGIAGGLIIMWLGALVVWRRPRQK
jgi:nickel/cobalt transporter (NiCoT) family protein